MISKILKDCFTERDNRTFDLKRFQWFIGSVIFFGLEIYSVGFKGTTYDALAFGGGLAATLGAGAWSLGKGGDTPPPPSDDPVTSCKDGSD